jgi:putative DNA primase/helicase
MSAGAKIPAELQFLGQKSGSVERTLPSIGIERISEELAHLGETDVDNAERFAKRCGHKVIFTKSLGWCVFDGKRYVPDARMKCVELAKDVTRRIKDEVRHLAAGAMQAQRARFAQSSMSKGHIDRMLDLAQGLLVVEDNALDSDPWLFNTATCTINLRTGFGYPHDSRDLFTKIARVKAKPGAKCPVFLSFLHRVTAGDADLQNFIQKAVGYSLTGATQEQVFFFLYGKSGNNGKSTLINCIREMLGDYAIHAQTETFLTKQYDNAIPADLARLEGARFVSAVEANAKRHLDEAKIKSLTGGEPITARLLYKNFSQFVPEFKIWFAANDAPRVHASDDALWRRIRTIPFNVSIPASEVDPDLLCKLTAEWPGILNWAIQGCLKWQKERLGEPLAVQNASAKWRNDVDHVRRFVDVLISTEN